VISGERHVLYHRIFYETDPGKRMTKLLFPLICAAVLLSGCGIIYKQDIQQGNVLKQEQVDMLSPGMNRRQIALLLGTPAVSDPFHRDRWDYVSAQKEGGSDLETRRHLSLFFEGNQLARIEGNLKPSDASVLSEEEIEEAVEKAKDGTTETVGPQQQQQRRGPRTDPDTPPQR
jgi:outer membrane protein assembly factor BamE